MLSPRSLSLNHTRIPPCSRDYTDGRTLILFPTLVSEPLALLWTKNGGYLLYLPFHLPFLFPPLFPVLFALPSFFPFHALLFLSHSLAPFTLIFLPAPLFLPVKSS